MTREAERARELRRIRWELTSGPREITKGMTGGLWLIARSPTRPDGTKPIPIAIRVGQNAAGQFSCTGLIVGFDPPGAVNEVTARAVHEIRLGELLEAAAMHPVVREAVRETDVVRKVGARGAKTPRNADPELLRVRDEYRRIRREHRRSPYAELATDVLHSSEATARRRVAEAVACGLLDPEEVPTRRKS
ncbi:MAG TPA: hypothetical protein VN636_18275 [Acidimicrobiia bacterium]|nr:hypothetical protein [Acidimicrobiia bacterium]